jgi:hypothetical protein
VIVWIIQIIFGEKSSWCESGDYCHPNDIVHRPTGLDGFPEERMHISTFLEDFQNGKDAILWRSLLRSSSEEMLALMS